MIDEFCKQIISVCLQSSSISLHQSNKNVKTIPNWNENVKEKKLIILALHV